MMFDILLYLYDTYLYADRFPDAEQLTRKLSAAGFEDDAIGEALDWLAPLNALAPAAEPPWPPSVRIYTDAECGRLASGGRGFLAYLESTGLLPAHAREWIIDRALALPEAHVGAERVKWIALLALWKLKGSGEVLWLEDLVRGVDDIGDEGMDVTLH